MNRKKIKQLYTDNKTTVISGLLALALVVSLASVQVSAKYFAAQTPPAPDNTGDTQDPPPPPPPPPPSSDGNLPAGDNQLPPTEADGQPQPDQGTMYPDSNNDGNWPDGDNGLPPTGSGDQPYPGDHMPTSDGNYPDGGDNYIDYPSNSDTSYPKPDDYKQPYDDNYRPDNNLPTDNYQPNDNYKPEGDYRPEENNNYNDYSTDNRYMPGTDESKKDGECIDNDVDDPDCFPDKNYDDRQPDDRYNNNYDNNQPDDRYNDNYNNNQPDDRYNNNYDNNQPDDRYNDNYDDNQSNDQYNDNRDDNYNRGPDTGRMVEDMKRQIKDFSRPLRDMERELTKVERELKRAGSTEDEITEYTIQLKKIINNFEENIAKAESMADELAEISDDTDMDKINDKFEDIKDLLFDLDSQEFFDKMNSIQAKVNFARASRDFDRQITQMERELKRMTDKEDLGAEATKKVQTIIDSLKSKRDEIAAELDNIDDPQEAQWLVEDLWDYMNDKEFEIREAFESLHQAKSCQFFAKDIKRIPEHIKFARDSIERKKDNPKFASAVREGEKIIDEIEYLFAKAKTVIDEGKCGPDVENIMREMEDLGFRAERIMDQLQDGNNDLRGPSFAYDSDDIANSIDISDKEFIKELIAQISREQLNDVVQEMLKTQSNILEEMSQIKGTQNKKQMSKALGVATRIPEAYKEQFIGTKKDMMLEIDDIDNKIAQLQEQKKLAQKELQQFETAKDKLANYNFGSETGREIKGELESMKILAESDPDAFAEKVEEFTNSVDASIIKAKKEKLNKGIIQFQDVDDNEWFFSHVTDAKNANIVSGVKDAEGNITGFDPGGNLTKAQILKIALEAAGIDVKEVGGAWWKGYYETAKERNFNITKRNNESQVGNFSNRGEAIGLILEALAVEPSDPSEISFPDVSKNHPYAGYIEKAKKLGIISGRPDGTFGPDDNVNRAETMKMTMNALQITGKGITTN